MNLDAGASDFGIVSIKSRSSRLAGTFGADAQDRLTARLQTHGTQPNISTQPYGKNNRSRHGDPPLYKSLL